MNQHDTHPFLVVKVDGNGRGELIQGPQWLFDAGDFVNLTRHLDHSNSAQAGPSELSHRTELGYVHPGLPYPMHGILWKQAALNEGLDAQYGLFLPKIHDKPAFEALLSAFPRPISPHLAKRTEFVVLNARGQILASTVPLNAPGSAAPAHEHAASPPSPANSLAEANNGVCRSRFKTTVFGLIETDATAPAALDIAHSAGEKPVLNQHVVHHRGQDVMTIACISIVNLGRLLDKVHDLTHLLELHKTMLWRVGHNIRTPLNAVYGLWQILHIEHPDLLKKNHQRTEIVKASIHQISQTIDDAILIPSVACDAPALGQKSDLREAIEVALRMSSQMIDAKQLRFALAGPATQVKAAQHVVVELLLNLISNAVKFSPSGAEVQVRWAPAQNDNAVVLKLDNPVEAPESTEPKNIEHTLRTTRQLHKRTSVAGTGVGLATCAFLLRQLGGDMLPTVITDGQATSGLSLPMSPQATE